MADSNDTQARVQGQVARPGRAPTSVRQKIFDALGWLAFALLVPPALSMLGLPKLQELVSGELGAWGSPFALVMYFYALLFLRVIFGTDQRYFPVVLGYLVSFLCFSNSLDIGAMAWFREALHKVPALSYDAISFAFGVIAVFLGNALSRARKAGAVVDLIVLVLVPAAGVFLSGLYLPPLLGM
ncbi:MAG: hypothetical protein JXA15_12230 [Spirochaetales bacterium]|nr:hypothetical protein [Spirochaetales bacterium]